MTEHTDSVLDHAKGAEADVVILLNMKGGTRGFPSGVQDDPLMQLILGETDAYPDSVFTRELSGSEYGRWVEVVDLRVESGLPACPGCRVGRQHVDAACICADILR